MMFSKAFIALATAVFVAASPAARRADSVDCYFNMTPKPDLGVDGLQNSIKLAIGIPFEDDYPSHKYHGQEIIFRHADGTYAVTAVLTLDGVSNQDLFAYIHRWKGNTLDGHESQWRVNAVNCYA